LQKSQRSWKMLIRACLVTCLLFLSGVNTENAEDILNNKIINLERENSRLKKHLETISGQRDMVIFQQFKPIYFQKEKKLKLGKQVKNIYSVIVILGTIDTKCISSV
jgi:hypothetical protein